MTVGEENRKSGLDDLVTEAGAGIIEAVQLLADSRYSLHICTSVSMCLRTESYLSAGTYVDSLLAVGFFLLGVHGSAPHHHPHVVAVCGVARLRFL